MKRHAGWSGLIGLLVVLALVGYAVAQQSKPGGTLRLAWEADVTGLDPHLSNGIQAWHVVGNLFNSLLTIDAHTVQFTLKHPSMTLLPTLAANRTGFLQMSPASYKQWGKEVVEKMMLTSVASVPLLHAARTYVKGYEHLHGYKIRFETTWLEKP